MRVAVPFVRGGKYDTVQNDWEKSLKNGKSPAWQRDQPPGLGLKVIFLGKKYAEEFAALIEAGHSQYQAREGLEKSEPEPVFKDYAAHCRYIMEEDEEEMLDLLNHLRKKAGLAPIDTLDEKCEFIILKQTEPGKADSDFAVAANKAKILMGYTEEALPSIVFKDREVRVSGLFMARVGVSASAEEQAEAERLARRQKIQRWEANLAKSRERKAARARRAKAAVRRATGKYDWTAGTV